MRELSVDEAERISREVHSKAHEAVGCSYCVIPVYSTPSPEESEEVSTEGSRTRSCRMPAG